MKALIVFISLTGIIHLSWLDILDWSQTGKHHRFPCSRRSLCASFSCRVWLLTSMGFVSIIQSQAYFEAITEGKREKLSKHISPHWYLINTYQSDFCSSRLLLIKTSVTSWTVTQTSDQWYSILIAIQDSINSEKKQVTIGGFLSAIVVAGVDVSCCPVLPIAEASPESTMLISSVDLKRSRLKLYLVQLSLIIK